MNTKELINKVCSQNPVKANILTLSVLNYKHSAAPPIIRVFQVLLKNRSEQVSKTVHANFSFRFLHEVEKSLRVVETPSSTRITRDQRVWINRTNTATLWISVLSTRVLPLKLPPIMSFTVYNYVMQLKFLAAPKGEDQLRPSFFFHEPNCSMK